MMNNRHLYSLASFAAIAFLGACASAPIPYKTPVSVTPPSGQVAVSQAVTLLDASGSNELIFADSKATLESLVAAMPNGRYQAGDIHFGGNKREIVPIAAFDRAKLASAAKDASFLGGSTPLYSVIEDELAAGIGEGSGKAAVVVISDGLATDYAGRSGADQRTIDAARALASSRGGQLCFHSVQTGDSAEGGALLKSLSQVTPCGSYRTAASLGTASALQQFARTAYLGAAPKPRETPVAATNVDSDGDGVLDPLDQCPGTLRQAPVDARGCWTLKGLRFAVNGAAIDPQSADLRDTLAVLRANPGVKVRIDGHTDSDGAAAYNQDLSQRRAKAVRDYFVAEGLDASRFEVKGFGETKPVAKNDSRENKRKNRRVELTIVD